jgi:C4-dicarboxylate-specific signal transduction histidine kinase
MSKKIVQDSLNGNLYVKNSESGAKFYIELNI